MTEKQSRVLAFIREYLDRAGIAPTMEQIRVEMGTKGKASAHRMVEALVAQGKLVREPRRGARNIRLPGFDLSAVPTPTLAAELERRRRA